VALCCEFRFSSSLQAKLVSPSRVFFSHATSLTPRASADSPTSALLVRSTQSNSPYELFDPIHSFLETHEFPPGFSLRLKFYGGKSTFKGIWEPAGEKKMAGVLEVSYLAGWGLSKREKERPWVFKRKRTDRTRFTFRSVRPDP